MMAVSKWDFPPFAHVLLFAAGVDRCRPPLPAGARVRPEDTQTRMVRDQCRQPVKALALAGWAVSVTYRASAAPWSAAVCGERPPPTTLRLCQFNDPAQRFWAWLWAGRPGVFGFVRFSASFRFRLHRGLQFSLRFGLRLCFFYCLCLCL